MRVSVQYVKEHLEQILPAKDGEEVEVNRELDGAVRLKLVEKRVREPLWGIAKGQIWMADDWDSPETNQAIADLFYGETEK